MSREIIRQEIDQILETIAEQWEIIRAYERKIPLIELDILMGNIRKLYEDLYLIDKLNKTPGFDPSKIKSQITREPSIMFETGVKPKSVEKPEADNSPSASGADSATNKEPLSEPEPEQIIKSEPEEKIQDGSGQVESEQNEPLPNSDAGTGDQSSSLSGSLYKKDVNQDREEEITTKQDQPSSEMETARPNPQGEEPVRERPIQNKPTPVSAPDLFGSQTPSLADKFQSEKKSIKDQLTISARGDDNSLGNKMQQVPITDLKSAIGINEKFLFINELFKGDLAGYNRAIESLNACGSRQEATAKLEELRGQFGWPEHATTYKRLEDILKRRYLE